MAESCLDSWAYGACFARDTEILTRALQISLSDTSSSDETLSASTSPAPASQPEPDSNRTNRPDRIVSAGRIAKRKPRASRRAPTTYVTADPANFREMVQRMTGVRFGDPVFPVEPVRTRTGSNRAGEQQGTLPTLDTSAVLLDRLEMVQPTGQVEPVFELENFFNFQNFPTLESWGSLDG